MDRNAKALLAAPVIGFFVTCVLFVGLFVPMLSRAAEVLLTPGTYLPQAYWGGFHDVGPILLALALNAVFYSVLAFAVMSMRTRARTPDRVR